MRNPKIDIIRRSITNLTNRRNSNIELKEPQESVVNTKLKSEIEVLNKLRDSNPEDFL